MISVPNQTNAFDCLGFAMDIWGEISTWKVEVWFLNSRGKLYLRFLEFEPEFLVVYGLIVSVGTDRARPSRSADQGTHV